MKKMILVLTMLTATVTAQAHFVWLERDGTGPARAYFGEWDNDVIEKTGGALDRIKSPQAWLGAGKDVLKLERRADHIEIAAKGAGDVVLIEAGLAPREDKKSGGKTKGIFYAKAGRSGTQGRLDLELVPTAPNVNQFVLLFRGAPLEKTGVTVFGPPKWEKSLRTDDEGRVTIPTPWAGQYVIEVAHIEEQPGEFSGEKYDRLRHVATLSFVNAEGKPWTAKR
jgi:hypothetical protein